MSLLPACQVPPCAQVHTQLQLIVQIYIFTYFLFLFVGLACLAIGSLAYVTSEEGDDFPPDDRWGDSGHTGPRLPHGRRTAVTALAAASADGPVTLFDTASRAARLELEGHGFGTTALASSADGAHLTTAGQDGTARSWDPGTGQVRFRVEGGAAWVEHLAWSPRDALLATAAGRKLGLWDDHGRLVRAYPDQPRTVADVRWNPRGVELASAAYGQLALWGPDADEPRKWFGWKGSMLAMAWSLDGRHIATGDQDSTVHFWTVKPGEDLMIWRYHTKVRELSWDVTGRYLATGGGPHATVWDRSGQGTEPLAVGVRGDAPVSALAFRPFGPALAVGSRDGRLRVWRLGKRSERSGGANAGADVTRVAWHPSRRSLAASTATGTVAAFAAHWL